MQAADPGPRPAEGEQPAEVLEWDSEHFGFPIARAVGATLSAERAAAIDEWCSDRGIRCLYFLADPEDEETAAVTAAGGYRLVDFRATYGRTLERLDDLPSPREDVSIREATEEDLDYVRELARRCHRLTRFYVDGGFPRERCDALYAAWVERCYRDPSRSLRIPVVAGEPAGYHALGPVDDEAVAGAELLGLDPRHHGGGVATALYIDTFRFLAGRGARTYRAPRSARNLPVTRLHERLGMRTERIDVWHHKWYPEC